MLGGIQRVGKISVVLAVLVEDVVHTVGYQLLEIILLYETVDGNTNLCHEQNQHNSGVLLNKKKMKLLKIDRNNTTEIFIILNHFNLEV